MASAVVGCEVGTWDRVWQHSPDADRDSAQLLREQCNPRWALVCDAIEHTFDGIEGLRTIELGSGRGDLSALLAGCGAEVTLLDYCGRSLDQARVRFERLGLKANFVEGDLHADIGELTGQFDVSCSMGVIEHFKGPWRGRAVAAHRQVLRDGGMAVISVPHALGVPYRLWKLYLEVRGWWPYGTEIPYGRGELRRLAIAAGFESVELHVTGFWQSVGDHWSRGLLGLSPDWAARQRVQSPKSKVQSPKSVTPASPSVVGWPMALAVGDANLSAQTAMRSNWVAHGFSRGGHESANHSRPPPLKRWGTRPDWVARQSWVDSILGGTLTMLAWGTRPVVFG